MNAIQFFTDKDCFPTCDPMDVPQRPVGADLFELQMLLVDIGNGHNVWCGRLQNVSDGEKHYFKGWSGLVTNMQNILTPFAQLKVLNVLLPMKDKYIADMIRGNL
jgi:hypothetical protein